MKIFADLYSSGCPELSLRWKVTFCTCSCEFMQKRLWAAVRTTLLAMSAPAERLTDPEMMQEMTPMAV
jgi:hypothetical protein